MCKLRNVVIKVLILSLLPFLVLFRLDSDQRLLDLSLRRHLSKTLFNALSSGQLLASVPLCVPSHSRLLHGQPHEDHGKETNVRILSVEMHSLSLSASFSLSLSLSILVSVFLSVLVSVSLSVLVSVSLSLL